MRTLPQRCAAEVLEAVPLVMRSIRTEMRKYRSLNLSVPQFRVLMFLARNEGAPLLTVAEHIEILAPAASRIVDGLVGRQLIRREVSPSDRRHVALSLTPRGKAMMRTIRARARAALARKIKVLSNPDLARIREGMQALRSAFTSPLA